MKIRITENKIRLRLKEPEVRRLHEDASIDERLSFGPDQQLCFRLETYDAADFSVSYQEGLVTVNMPRSFSDTLATTDRVGYESTIHNGSIAPLYLLIEKDFECLDAPDADNEGAYPNPKQAC